MTKEDEKSSGRGNQEDASGVDEDCAVGGWMLGVVSGRLEEFGKISRFRMCCDSGGKQASTLIGTTLILQKTLRFRPQVSGYF